MGSWERTAVHGVFLYVFFLGNGAEKGSEFGQVFGGIVVLADGTPHPYSPFCTHVLLFASIFLLFRNKSRVGFSPPEEG